MANTHGTRSYAIHEQEIGASTLDQPVANDAVSSLEESASNGLTVISSTTDMEQDVSTDCHHVMEEVPDILNQCIHWLLDQAASTYPSNTAVVCGHVTLTYHDLHLRANGLASYLIDRGVQRGDLVGVALDRSVDLIVALIAVLKSGAAYIPIDPTLPQARIAQILDSAAPKYLVVTADDSYPFRSSCEYVSFAQSEPMSTTGPCCKVNVEIHPDDLAYVMYTSGSTGVPKGVAISHGAASNFLSAMQRVPGIDNSDRGLAISTIAFDMALFEIFAPLVSGATVVLAQTGQCKDPQALLHLMIRHSITMMLATPTTWQMLLDSGWKGEPRLKHIMCGGESLSRRLADQLLTCGDAIWNKYGPTEATACASIWRVHRNEAILIGEPVANVSLYVLDNDLKPVPVGSPGELFIGGAGVALGYYQNEDQTRSRFLANPFHKGRMYRTGDLACFLSPGKLSVIGRADNQVKIRGNRVELGDIESAIAAHPSVSSTAVISRAGRLVAYCVRQSTTPSSIDDDNTRVVEWTTISDQVYCDDNTTAGWLSSYDRSPFSTEEMRDWLMSSVRKILSFAPQHVAEIGAGTGMLLFEIAPSCVSYFAADASQVVVQRTRDQLQAQALTHVVYEQYEAHNLPVANKLYDTVVINSVIQCFPSIDYLLSVLRWAVDAVEVGRVFLGDLRDLRFLSVFHRDIVRCRAGDKVDEAELERRAFHAIRGDSELVLSPDFFANLPSLLRCITSVDVTLRQGQYANEMSRFRYDVVLHVGSKAPRLQTEEIDWNGCTLTSTTLGSQLALASKTSALRINNIPNGRLREVYYRLMPGPDRRLSKSDWVDPSQLMNLGKMHDLTSALLPCRGGDIWAFDIIFWPTVTRMSPDLTMREPQSLDPKSLKSYVNQPLAIGKDRTNIKNLLRPWLVDRLPEYMIPAFFVEIDRLPVTFNGKVDRNALPDHMEPHARTVGRPNNDMQRHILAIWSSVLDRDDIDIHDNFFEIGGDSIRVIRVQAGLEKVLGQRVSVATLFQYFTIETLAGSLSVENNTNVPIANGHSREASAAGPEDIAIVSMACRLPGEITTPADFWTLLETGGDAISFVPKDRWDADAVYDPIPGVPGKSQCRHGGFLSRNSIDTFDASIFKMSLREAREVDPTQRIILETTWEAFERAGYTKQQLNGSSTGVFVGISNIPAHHDCENAPSLTDFQGYAGTGSAGATTSGRISYVFGLEGPCLTVDTACSSSLVSTHLACNALRQGECDIAISGGVALLPTPALHVEFSQLRGISLDGRCRSFSNDAQGVGFAEGAATVVLKRLSDAQRDGDVIQAVLRGTATNHDGHTASLTTPSAAAQQRLIRSALAASNLHPGDVDYVEAHGTGTSLGDPIEGEGLAKVYGGEYRDHMNPLLVGTAKSNVGHTQAAAGLVGLLKVVLALRNQTLPRTLHSENPTSAIDWHDANMMLVQENRRWIPKDHRKRRAGISAFGIGGTNAHVIVEEAPEPVNKHVNGDREPDFCPGQLTPVLPVMVSGLSPQALQDQARRLRSHLESHANRLVDTAFTLAVKRNHFPCRRVLLAQDNADLMEKLSEFSNSTDVRGSRGPDVAPRLAMLFTGQGSELLNAGRKLAMQYPVFYHLLKDVALCFDGILDQPLLEVMDAADDTELAALLRQTNYGQPALFTLQVALWRWWEYLGVRPNIVFGHSVGEIAAAHAVGIMSLTDASRLVAIRGQLMYEIPLQGTMASIESDATDIGAMIHELGIDANVDIAAHNTSSQTIVSGDRNAVEQLTAVFRERGSRVTALATPHAFHSHHVDGILARLLAAAETIHFKPATTAIVSGLTGQLAQDGQLQSATYWVDQARKAVRFKDGIKTLAGENVKVFLELGPQPILCGLGAACLDGKDPGSLVWCPSLNSKHDDIQVLYGSLARLHETHVWIDWSRCFEVWNCGMVDLPTYAFQRETLPTIGNKSRSRKSTENSHQEKASGEFEADNDHFDLFQMNWQRVDDRKIRHVTEHWGLLCIDKASSEAAEIASALTKAQVTMSLITDIKAGEHLDGILCLWPSDPMDPIRSCEITEAAISQLQYAARRQSKQPLVWMTEYAVHTTTGGEQYDGTHSLVTAPLWGLMRTARAEHPELQLRMIGAASKTGGTSWDDVLVALGLDLEPDLLLQNHSILVPRLGHADELPTAVDPQIIRTDGAVLITGGFGELGQNVARWLVSAHGIRDLVLTSRQGVESSGAQALLAELAHRGAHVDAVAGDIADINHARSLLARFGPHRPLRGVIHAAGVPSAGALTSLPMQSCSPVFSSKVTGTWNLHQLTKNLDLDFFVLCSSLSAAIGTTGFGAYAAANSFLDTLAQVRSAEGLPASSVGLGAFEGGMSSSLTQARRIGFARAGVGVLQCNQVLYAFEKAIRSKRPLTLAFKLDLDRWQKYHEAQNGVPVLFRSLLAISDRQPVTKSPTLLRDVLAQTAPALRLNICLQVVTKVVAQTSGFAEETVDPDRPFQDIGMDSFTATLMRSQLAKLTDIQLSTSIFFLHTTPATLSRFILSKLLPQASSPSTSALMLNGGSSLDKKATCEGRLDRTFSFENVKQDLQHQDQPGAVFVTGATGFVGAFLVHELLKRGLIAHCIVRGADDEQARKRLVKVLASHELWKVEYEDRLIVAAGDMELYQFGLPDDRFLDLANKVDVICHAGGLVDWMRPFEYYVGPNIISTHEILRLANLGRHKAVHVVSTIATLPMHSGHGLSDDDPEHGYATSKWISERLVDAARWRGAKASVYRLPFVSAATSNGQFRLDKHDFLHNLIVGSIDLGVSPHIDADLSLVLPVDYLCQSIASIMVQEPDRIGQDFDFANNHAIRFDEYFDRLNPDSQSRIVPFTDWRQQALNYATSHPSSALARIGPVLDGCTEQDAVAMFRVLLPGRHVLGGKDYPAPPTDQDAIDKYRRRIDGHELAESRGRLPRNSVQ